MSIIQRKRLKWVVVFSMFVLFIYCRAEKKMENKDTNSQEVQAMGEGNNQWWKSLPRKEWSQFKKISQKQSWFEVYEIRKDVYAIYEPGQWEEVISYLILGNKKALLFDTGLGIGDMYAVVKEITMLPVTVVNSHTHYDHTGGNHQFKTIFTGPSKFAQDNAKGQSHASVSEFVGKGWIWKPVPEGFQKENYSIKPFKITGVLEDGEKIDLGGRSLKVVYTPGHSPDSICLLDRHHKLLFMGDSFYLATLYANLDGSDFNQYKKSAQTLAGLEKDVDYILPSHNVPLLKSQYLSALKDAMLAVEIPNTPYIITDGSRKYKFDGFSVMVSEPPPWK